jgi:hypothetical protein
LIQKEQDHWFKVLAHSRPKTVYFPPCHERIHNTG